MNYMKVKVRELMPNPYRDMANYPINQDKLQTLKKSIEQTGFWDNILARQVNGVIQIAYGHHRLQALKEVFSPDYQVEVPIKDLSDELMLKIMANENMEEWQSSVAIIDETVRAVRIFLLGRQNGHISARIIAEFLGWEGWKVEDSISRINAIEKSGVDKQAVESIPTATASTTFATAVKSENLTAGQQRRIANKIAESGNYSPEAVKLAVKREAAPPKSKKDIEDKQQQDLVQNFDNYLANVTEIASKLKNEVQKMRGMKDLIRNYQPEQFENRLHLQLSLEGLQITIKNTLKTLNNE